MRVCVYAFVTVDTCRYIYCSRRLCTAGKKEKKRKSEMNKPTVIHLQTPVFIINEECVEHGVLLSNPHPPPFTSSPCRTLGISIWFCGIRRHRRWGFRDKGEGCMTRGSSGRHKECTYVYDCSSSSSCLQSKYDRQWQKYYTSHPP